MIRLRAIVFVLSCGFLLPMVRAEDAEKKYSFKLSHRSEVGERYEVQVSLHKTLETPDQKTVREVKLAGTETVDAIAPGGVMSAMAFEIKEYSFDKQENGAGDGIQNPLAGVKQMRVKRSADGVEFTNPDANEAIDEAAREGLRLIFERISAVEANQDDVAKAHVARKVGEKWEGDYDASRNLAGGSGFELDPKTHKIIYELKKVKKINGDEQLVIACETSGRILKMPAFKGQTFKEGEFKTSYTAIVPVDKAIKSLEIVSETTLEAKYENDEGNETKNLMQQKKTLVRRLIKDGK